MICRVRLILGKRREEEEGERGDLLPSRLVVNTSSGVRGLLGSAESFPCLGLFVCPPAKIPSGEQHVQDNGEQGSKLVIDHNRVATHCVRLSSSVFCRMVFQPELWLTPWIGTLSL